MARVKIRKPGYENRAHPTNAQIDERRQRVVDIVKEISHSGVRRIGVRQVEYQYVTRKFGTKDDMKKVGEDLVKLREGDKKVIRGLFRIPYGWFLDDSRAIRKPLAFNSISERLEMSAQNYRRALWADTPDYIEFALEKEGLAGIVEEETENYDVILFPVKGYNSLTGLWEAANRYAERAHQNIFIYTLGDFDPSGINAIEVAEATIRKMLKEDLKADVNIQFIKLALHHEDLARYSLAVRTTNTNDPRAKEHIAKYGLESSLELDVVLPDDLRWMVRNAIKRHLDGRRLIRLKRAERREIARLRQIAEDEAEDE